MRNTKILILLICSFLSPVFGYSESIKLKQRAINQVISQHASEMKTRGVVLIGSGYSFPNNLNSIDVDYLSKRKISINEARCEFVYGAERLIALMNEKEVLRPLLANYPANITNIEYMIAFHEEQNKYPQSPYIALVTNIDDRISYAIYDSTKGSLYRFHSETYEEAKRIVEEENAQKNIQTFGCNFSENSITDIADHNSYIRAKRGRVPSGKFIKSKNSTATSDHGSLEVSYKSVIEMSGYRFKEKYGSAE